VELVKRASKGRVMQDNTLEIAREWIQSVLESAKAGFPSVGFGLSETEVNTYDVVFFVQGVQRRLKVHLDVPTLIAIAEIDGLVRVETAAIIVERARLDRWIS